MDLTLKQNDKSYQDLILEIIQKNDLLKEEIRRISKEIEANSIKIEFYKQLIAQGLSEFTIGEKVNYSTFDGKGFKIGYISKIRLSSLGNTIYYIKDEKGKKVNLEHINKIIKL